MTDAPALLRLAAWLRAGARTAVGMHPRWTGLSTGPGMMAALFLLNLGVDVLLQRLYIEGPASFYWQALAGGWLMLALLPWCAWLVRGSTGSVLTATAPDTARLFTMLQAQNLALSLLVGLVYLAMIHARVEAPARYGALAGWALWSAPPVLAMLPQLMLLWRGGNHEVLPSTTAIMVLIAGQALVMAARPADFWYPVQSGEEVRRFELTQEAIEAQSRRLADQLSALKPQRPGHVDMYVLTFAPYNQDVFKRESGVVAQVMAQRFDAEGRVLQLVNHPETASTLPWATPLNLHRAIARVAQLMDPDEDVLFIHLTSHGAANGEMAARFYPLTVQELTPALLKDWLDEAGVRNRVISVSACYSGSWIKPLSGDSTLVMTAADADHTSYGCGSKSELTFFGQAMYDEQLRNVTLDFEQAHAAARKVILKREQEAGKSDGYSNPQISVGPAIRAPLAALAAAAQPSTAATPSALAQPRAPARVATSGSAR